MGRLPDAELVRLVTELRPFADPETAIAVILGESGGDPSAVNRQPDNIDRGLWQISSKWHPNVSDAAAFDPEASTRYAYNLSSGGTDYNAWHATRASTFAGHRATAAAMLAANPSTGSSGGSWLGGVVGALPLPGGLTVGTADDAARNVVENVPVISNVADLVALAGKALGVLVSADFWKRVGFGVAGLVLVYLGLVAIFGRSALAIGTTVASRGAVSLPDSPTQML
jgi:hypothetical protein